MFENKEGRYERIILSFLIRDVENVKRLMSRDVQAYYFLNENNREFFKCIINHYKNTQLLLKKNIYMDMIVTNPDINPDDYFNYEKVYDIIYNSYINSEDFDYYLNKFIQDGCHNRIIKVFENYLEDREEFGNEEALSDLKRRVSSIEFEGISLDYQIMDYVKDIDRQIADIVNRKEHPELYAGIPTGFTSLDNVFNGFEKGTLNLVIGMTGTGKSTFVSNIAYHHAFTLEKKVVVLSLEDNIDIWAHKITAQETGIPLTNILKGHTTDEQLEKIKTIKANKSKHSSKGEYRIIQMPPRKFTAQMIEEILDKEIEFQPDIIICDQLSLVAPSIRRGGRIDFEFGDVSKELAAIGKRKNSVMLVTCQANRSAIKNLKNNRVIDIQIENISQSNQPAEDARSVLALQTNDHDDSVEESVYDIRILKQSYGPVNVDVQLIFRKAYCTFVSGEIISDDYQEDDAIMVPDPIVPDETRAKLEKIIDDADLYISPKDNQGNNNADSPFGEDIGSFLNG